MEVTCLFICSGLVTQNVTVGFERVSYVVSETENILVINIIASGRFDGPIVLLINTTDETGRGMCICMCVQLFYSTYSFFPENDDFMFGTETMLSHTLIEFPIQVSILVFGDCITEGNETFAINLFSTGQDGVMIDNSVSHITILDSPAINDGKSFK